MHTHHRTYSGHTLRITNSLFEKCISMHLNVAFEKVFYMLSSQCDMKKFIIYF